LPGALLGLLGFRALIGLSIELTTLPRLIGTRIPELMGARN
jgi:hypothetical protein